MARLLLLRCGLAACSAPATRTEWTMPSMWRDQ
jgi:hypothetical protein